MQRLDREQAALEAALSDFEHQLRRVNDGLERAGFRSAGLEREQARLQTNLARIRRELAQVLAHRSRLVARD